MSHGVLVGLDLGTTNVKAVTRDVDRDHWWVETARTPWRSDPRLGRWMDPDDLFAVVVALLDAATRGTADRLRAIGVTGMAESGVVTDGDGRSVMPVLSWDHRSTASDDRDLAASLPDFCATTGLPAGPKPSLVTWRWWTRTRGPHPPDSRWSSVPEWVVAALGGRRVSEVSLAARTGWLDLDHRDWWQPALRWSGARRDQFGPLVSAGTPAGHVTTVEGCAGAILTVAGHDQPCSAVGAGAVAPGQVVHSCGTAEVVMRALEQMPSPGRRRRLAESGFAVGPHVLPDRHLAIGGHPSGRTLSRLLDRLGLDDPATADELAAVVTKAAGVEAFEDLAAVDAWLSRPPADGDPPRGVVWDAAVEAVARASQDLVDRFVTLTGPAAAVVRLGGWATRDGLLARRMAGLDRRHVVAGPVAAAAHGAVTFAAHAVGLASPDPPAPDRDRSSTGRP